MPFNPTGSCPPAGSPIRPVELRDDSTFQFRCHPGIACFNACCKDIDITLTPYDADDAMLEALARDEDKLLAFSMRFLNQVLFGAQTIPIRQGARERRINERKAVWAARRRDAVARHREHLQRQQYGE